MLWSSLRDLALFAICMSLCSWCFFINPNWRLLQAYCGFWCHLAMQARRWATVCGLYLDQGWGENIIWVHRSNPGFLCSRDSPAQNKIDKVPEDIPLSVSVTMLPKRIGVPCTAGRQMVVLFYENIPILHNSHVIGHLAWYSAFNSHVLRIWQFGRAQFVIGCECPCVSMFGCISKYFRKRRDQKISKNERPEAIPGCEMLGGPHGGAKATIVDKDRRHTMEVHMWLSCTVTPAG